MRFRTLYELMDHYRDSEVHLAEDSPVDTDRVLQMTMDRLGPQSGRRPVRRIRWTGIIAAAVAVLAMSVVWDV